MPKELTSQNLRAACLAAALILLSGCGVGPFPRRRPGSDMTLPPSTTDWLIEAALGCASPVGTKGVGGAREVAICQKATGDTVPDPKQTPPPPTKTP
jgi:hypothetical protein